MMDESQQNHPLSLERKTIFPIPMTASQFSEGSLGQSYFPDELAGKFRSVDFNLPYFACKQYRFYEPSPGLLLHLFTIGNEEAKRLATVNGIQSLGNLLNTSHEDLTTAINIKQRPGKHRQEIIEKFENGIQVFFEQLNIGPAGFLLADVLKQPPEAAKSVEEDNVRREKVSAALRDLPSLRQDLLLYRYGFNDGMFHDDGTTAMLLKKTRTWTMQTTDPAIGELRASLQKHSPELFTE